MKLHKNPFSRPAARRVCLGGIAVTGGAVLLISSLPAFAGENESTQYADFCEVTILPGAEGNGEGMVSAMDESGTYLGGRTDAEDSFNMPAIWQDGEVSHIDFASTGEEISEGAVSGINTGGDAVGHAYFTALEGRQVFAYIDGEAVLLPAPDDRESVEANAINDDGVIVGTVTDGETGERFPVMWETADSEPDALPLPDGSVSGRAHDIDNDGQIVGYYATETETPDRDTTAYLWNADGSQGQDLTKDTYAKATEVAGDWVGGRTRIDSEEANAIRWHNGESDEFDMNMVHDINARGDAVGDWTNRAERARAAKYTADGRLYMLPFPERAGQSMAYAVSADGATIAGWISDTRDFEMAVYTPAVWHCEE